MQKPELALALFAQSDSVLAKLPDQAQVFCVGGAVRDLLLGNTSSDRDYVVVGATVDHMLQAGFVPVGKDFPVFLHPISHDEYALARTERKSGKGYKGFVFLADPSVTLEQDLARRDLTINAIAIDNAGNIIDPCHGMQDLHNKTLRHVSDAFSEDPVRLLRLARFAARWPEFQVAQQTQALCKKIVADGEAHALVAERVWQELQTGLMESKPSRMIGLLMGFGAWQTIVSSNALVHPDTLRRLDTAATQGLPLEARFGLLTHNLGGAPIDPARFKSPKSCFEFAQLLQICSSTVPKDFGCADSVLEWIFAADFQRKPERFSVLLQCLMLEGVLEQARLELLQEVQALFTAPGAIADIASAAQLAEKNGGSAKEAVHTARLKLLKTHSRFL